MTLALTICRDYATWVQADEGIKLEQTCLPRGGRRRLPEPLDEVAAARAGEGQVEARRFREEGNLYVPTVC